MSVLMPPLVAYAFCTGYALEIACEERLRNGR